MSAVATMIEPSVLRAMLAAGATAEMIVAAVEADFDAEEKKKAVKRAQDAERQRKKRSTDASRGVTRAERTKKESRKDAGLGSGDESHKGAKDGPEKEGPPHPLKKTITPPNEAKASLPPERVLPKATRGARLPQDWHPDEALWAWAQDRLALTPEVLRFETGAFRDHFWGAPGQKGVKLDWNRTWKNWMREAVRRRGRAGIVGGATGGPPATGDDWRKAVREVEVTRGEGKADE